jgi:hypothetical protein
MKNNCLGKSIALGFLALAAAASVQGQSAYYQAVTNLNPAAYWPLQETVAPAQADVETNLGSLGAVANAYYSSVNAIHGMQGVTGDGDTAVSFQSGLNGSFLAVPTTDPRTAVTGAFTVEAWVYPTNAAGACIVAQTGPIGIGGLNGSTNSAGWALSYDSLPSLNENTFAGWSFHVFNGNGSGGGAEAVAAGAIQTFAWYHVVGVFDGTHAYLYVNGVSAGLTATVSGAYQPDTWDPLTIGCGRGLNNSRFGGSIDEVAIYNNALTGTQIANHYAAVSGSSYSATILADQPYMYWRMDSQGYTAPTAYPVAASFGTVNAGGYYLPGTTPGVAGPPYAGLGSPNYACQFTGIGNDTANLIADYANGVFFSNAVAYAGVTITNLDSSLNPISNSLSLMLWFKGNPADSSRFQTMFGRGDTSWRISLGNSGANAGKVQFNPGMGGADLVSAGVFNDGQWHQAVGVYYNSGNAASPAGWLATNYLYVDGVLNGTALVTNSASTRSILNTLLGGAPDYASSGNGNVYQNRFFAGSLAHVAYFSNALTAAQIQGVYSAAQTPAAIQTQPPVSTIANGGTTGSITMVAAGATNLQYQWYFNTSSNYSGATAVSAATNASLSFPVLAAGNTGYYFVTVTNSYGSATSILAQLTVITTPVITAQSPTGAFSLFPGQSSILSVTAGGPALVYQWYTNGVADLTSGLTSTYSLTNVMSAQSGETYQCVVANTYGSATNLLATLTVQLLPAFLTNSSYGSNVLALNPQGYWPMHEVATPLHGDVETNFGSLGALANGNYAEWIQPGSNVLHGFPGALAGDSDPAMAFFGNGSGGTGYLLVPRTLPGTALTPPFTVEAWVQPFNTTFADVVSEYGNGVNANNTGNNYGFRLVWAGNGFQVGYGNGTSSGYTFFTGSYRNPGQWYHVAVTYDGTNATLYVNGQYDSAGPLPYSSDPSIPLTIGSGLWTASGPTRGFNGGIDEVAVYPAMLQPSDIAQHYSDGVNPAPVTSYHHDVTSDNPLLYYRMDSPNYVAPPRSAWPVLNNYGSVALNGVYNPNLMPGAVSAGPKVDGLPVAGLAGANVTPGNGVSGFADAGYSPVYNPTGRVPVSVSAWFKGNPADSRFQIMFGNDSTWRCAMDGTVGKVHFNAGAGGEITSARVYNDGNWHQLVGVYTGTTAPGSNNLLYVDGVLDTQLSTASSSVGVVTSDILMFSDPEYTNNPVGVGRQFSGSVCEVAFWTNTILSASQVAALYASSEVAPTILVQPASGRAVDGGAGTYIYFGVVASGAASPPFQWYFNSTPSYSGATLLVNGSKYSSATTAQVTVTNLGGGDSGYYFVVITNNYGSVTSALASLLVYTNPVFVSQLPATYTNSGGTNLMNIFAGANPTFSASAIGIQPIDYQWFSNGVPVGPVSAYGACMLSNVQGNFSAYCVAANSSGSSTSSVWSASVIAAPTAPYPQAVLAAHPVGYWRLNEPNTAYGNPGVIANDYVSGNNGIYTNVSLGLQGYDSGTDPTETAAGFGLLTFNNSYANDIQGVDFAAPTGTATNFTVECWANAYPQTTTGAAILSKGVYSLNDSFVFDVDSLSPHHFRFYARNAAGTVENCTTTVAPDSNWHHFVGVCDETDGVLKFYIDGVLVSSTTISSTGGEYEPNYPMSIGSVQNSSETAAYTLQYVGSVNDVAVYNYALSAAQISAQFAASGTMPIITQQPMASTNVDQYATLVVPATVNGTLPLSIQWYDGNTGQPIAGQTNATLVVSNISASDSYYFIASNHYGTQQSGYVSVTVYSGAPQLYADISPTNVAAYVGSPATFGAGVLGTAPIYYHWYQDGTVIAGATNATYTVALLLGTNIYSCTASNSANGGSIVSSRAATAVGVSVPADSYSLSVLGNHPLAYWPLTETGGNIANDYVGGHDAYYTNVELDVAGFDPSNPDTAAGFGMLAGADSYAGEIDNSGSGLANLDFSGQGNAEFSVEAWVKGSASQVSGAGLVSKGAGGAEQFALEVSGGVFEFLVHDGVNVLHTCIATNQPDGNWHHLVGVCDQENGLVSLYVDGVDVAATAIQSGKGVLATSGATLPEANLVSIGSRTSAKTSGSFNYQFDGSMGGVALYQTALTAAQVQADFVAGSFVPPAISLEPTGRNVVITYTGTLESSTNAVGPYTPVSGASSPYKTPATNALMFYRASN